MASFNLLYGAEAEDLLLHHNRWAAALHEIMPKEGTDWERLAFLLSELRREGRENRLFQSLFEKVVKREGSRLLSFSIASPGFGSSCPVAEVAGVEESVALVFSVSFVGSIENPIFLY